MIAMIAGGWRIIALYAFTNRCIAAALVEACHQGVEVELYRDREQYDQEERGNSQTHDILRQCPDIRIRVKASHGLIHEKPS